MSDLLWVAGVLFLIVPGLVSWRLRFVRELDLPARLSIAFGCGVMIVSVILYVYSLAHIPWTRTTVGIPLLLLPVAGGRFPELRRQLATGNRQPLILIAIFIALTIYGVATARETCGDLIYFWGPKGQHFHYAGSIDIGFLSFSDYYLMHRDYPPLLPLTYAWASLVTHRFSWWGALDLTPVILAAIAFAFRGLSGRGDWYAAFFTAVLAFGFAVGMVAGGADPLLLFFEIVAVSALTFHGEDHGAQIVAALALGGAAFLKVEGAAFAVIVIVAWALVTRRVARPAALAIPAMVLLGSWIALMAHYKLLDQYGRGEQLLHFALLGSVLSITLREASYEFAWLPWAAAAAPLAIGRNFRRAALPLLVAGASMASTLFFYLHDPHPEWWIASSAVRILLTPLACLAVASAASGLAIPGTGEREGSPA